MNSPNADLLEPAKSARMFEKFNQLLVQNGLRESYFADSATLAVQTKFQQNKLDVLTAFDSCLQSLFKRNYKDLNSDNFVNVVMTSPKEFGLKENPSEVEIKQAILSALNDDAALKFCLLPENLEDASGHAGVKLFPPENGESVKDYWIWYIKCDGFVPGPAWMLIKRDGSEEAYHYAYF